MTRMNDDEWASFIPTYVGKVRANHTAPGCSGGSKCMIVELDEDGSARAFCFRCGAKGWRPAKGHWKPAGGAPAPAPVGGAGADSTWAVESHTVAGWGALPKGVRDWLVDGGMTSFSVLKNGVRWCPEKEKLYLPVEQDGMLVGWVVRGFDPKTYRVLRIIKGGFYGFYTRGKVEAPTACCLVEDVVSAWRVAPWMDCYTLLGTNLPTEVVTDILNRGYEQVYVFLDGDNPTVKLAARKMANRLSFLDTRVVDTGKDPKQHSPTELHDLLTS